MRLETRQLQLNLATISESALGRSLSKITRYKRAFSDAKDKVVVPAFLAAFRQQLKAKLSYGERKTKRTG